MLLARASTRTRIRSARGQELPRHGTQTLGPKSIIEAARTKNNCG